MGDHSKKFIMNEDEAVMEEMGEAGTNQVMKGLGCHTNRFGQMHKGDQEPQWALHRKAMT